MVPKELDASEKYIASIFRAEEYAKQKQELS
jgi:hypothetical protein